MGNIIYAEITYLAGRNCRVGKLVALGFLNLRGEYVPAFENVDYHTHSDFVADSDDSIATAIDSFMRSEFVSNRCQECGLELAMSDIHGVCKFRFYAPEARVQRRKKVLSAINLSFCGNSVIVREKVKNLYHRADGYRYEHTEQEIKPGALIWHDPKSASVSVNI